MNSKELRDKVIMCRTPSSVATSEWTSWSEKIRSKIVFDDPYQFLTWPCVRETMFVTHARNYIKSELDYILSLPQAGWRKALREHLAGNPVIVDDQLFTSGNLIHMVYHIAMFESLSGIEVSSLDTVLELGGGYAALWDEFYQLQEFQIHLGVGYIFSLDRGDK